ncbi:MAG: hypothetical protein IKK81_12755 [Prevotella sp.]|nr:hypothetical protein [Prevotella sp.]
MRRPDEWGKLQMFPTSFSFHTICLTIDAEAGEVVGVMKFMVTLSCEVLSLENWRKLKKDLKFYWLKHEQLACAFYFNDEKTFVISYNVDSQSLCYYCWDDKDDCFLIALLVTQLPELFDNVQSLICPSYLVKLIEDCINGKK